MTVRKTLGAALIGAALTVGGGVGAALACAICLSAVTVTTGQKLDASDQVALARVLSESRQFQLADAIKGDISPGATVEASADRTEMPPPQAGKLHLIARNAMSGLWTNFGEANAESADWLRKFVKTNDGRATTAPRVWPIITSVLAVPDSTNWSKRIALIAPYLESDDPLAAEIAFAELSRTPYEVMRELKPVLDADKLRRWVNDPALTKRRDAYLLLLGIAGGSDDATMLELRLAAARSAQDATHVAAMLAADLELGGASRVAWVEENYLLDHERSLPEIEAALLALNVQGGANSSVVPRQIVVDAYVRFIRERPPMAGFVATYLNDWKAWDAVPAYVEVLRANAVKDPASQFQILVYLRDSQNLKAQAAVAAFAAQAN